MMKKYKFTDETKEVDGKVLHRIIAERNLINGFRDVRIGDLGGWIEKENNLSHRGLSWVYDNSCVYGNARIYDNAAITKDSKVYGNVKIKNDAYVSRSNIYGDAVIKDHAKVSLNCNVYGSSVISGNAHINKNSIISGSSYIDNNLFINDNVYIRDSYLFGNMWVIGDTDIIDSTISANMLYITSGCISNNEIFYMGNYDSDVYYSTICFYKTKSGDIFVSENEDGYKGLLEKYSEYLNTKYLPCSDKKKFKMKTIDYVKEYFKLFESERRLKDNG